MKKQTIFDVDNYKKNIRRIKNKLPKDILKILDTNTRNMELINRKPSTKYHIIGGMWQGNAVHKDGTSYTKKELDQLNILNSIEKIVIGDIMFPTCQYCQENLKPIREKNPKKTKFCSTKCKKAHYALKQKREKSGAEIIWTQFNGIKTKEWSEMKATFKIIENEEEKFIIRQLQAKKSKWVNHSKV